MNTALVGTAMPMVFDAVLGQNSAQDLKDRLAPLLNRRGTCQLDAGAVCRLSTAAIQVITAFLVAARQAGLTVVFTAVSAAFQNAFGALGLAAELRQHLPEKRP